MTIRRWPLELLLVASAVLGTTGCFVSRAPLSAPGRALDPRLYGLWRCVPNDPAVTASAMMRIGPFDDLQYYADWVDDEPDPDPISAQTPLHFRVYPTLTGSTITLNVQLLRETAAREPWMFVRYDFVSEDQLDQLVFSFADSSRVTGATETARLDAVRRAITGIDVFDPLARCSRQPAP